MDQLRHATHLEEAAPFMEMGALTPALYARSIALFILAGMLEIGGGYLAVDDKPRSCHLVISALLGRHWSAARETTPTHSSR